MQASSSASIPAAAPQAPKLSRWLRWPLTAAAILLYAVLFGEVFLRLLLPQPLVPRYVTGSPEGIRANMPNVTFRQWTPEVDVRVHYNNAGMRDDRPAPPLAKAPGECRVALIGDSYFVGFESDWANSYAKKLEDDLRAAGRPCRVLNFAVSGFGQAEMAVALERRVLPYQPDLVLMSWHASDPMDNIRANLFELGSDGRLLSTGRSYLPGVETSDELMRWRIYRWAIENSHFYSAIRERAAAYAKVLLAVLRARELAGDPDEGGEPAAEAANDEEQHLRQGQPVRQGFLPLDAALILDIERQADAAGAKFMMVDIPINRGRTRGFVSATSLMFPPQFLAEVPNMSPIPAFEKAAGPDVKLYWERGHKHWTPLGNALAAKATADDIVRRGWLPPSAQQPVA